MTVYLVEIGQDYEGSTTLGVYSSFKLAEDFVNDWIERRSTDGFSFSKTHENAWHDDGCDWIQILEYKVDSNMVVIT